MALNLVEDRPGRKKLTLIEDRPERMDGGRVPTLGEAAIIAKEAIRPQIENIKSFGSGLVHGATFGNVGEKQDSTFGKVGEFIGEGVPIGASAAIAAPVAGAMGAGALGASALTGLVHSATKGAAQNKSVQETISNAAMESVGFPAIQSGFKALGYLRKALGVRIPESVANYFLNTPNKISSARINQGKESLGADLLKSPELKNEASRIGVFNKARFELGRLENQVQGELEVMSARQGAGLKVDEVADPRLYKNVLDDLSPAYEKYGDKESSALLKDLASRETPVLSIEEANKLRRILDSEVGNAYLNPSSQTPLKTDAIKSIANSIRVKLAETSPRLADLLGKQHLMMEVKNSLAPIITNKRRISDMSLFGYAIDKAQSNLTAPRALNAVLGKPSKVAPYAEKGARIGLSKYLE